MKYLKKKKRGDFSLNNIARTLLICFFTFISCSESDENEGEENTINCGETVWTSYIQSELTLWLTTGQQYSTNPTVANCNAFKSASEAYLNELEKVKECIPTVNIAEYEKELAEVKEEVSNISCQ